MRYTLSLPLLDDPTTDPSTERGVAILEQYYADRRANPKTLDVVGTIAPYVDGDPIAMPPGRQLISCVQNIGTPTQNNNGMGKLALAPAVARQSGDWLSIDLAGTFPENWTGPDRQNPKFSFGDVSLQVGSGSNWVEVASLPYDATDAGNQCGWVIDVDLGALDPAVTQLLADDSASLRMYSAKFGVISSEVDYYVVTDQLAVYAEQGGPADEFLSQGTLEPISVQVYRRGRVLDASECPPITMWEYCASPIQTPGGVETRTTDLQPGAPITVATDTSAAYVLTFQVQGETGFGQAFPPDRYDAFAYPPQFALTWAPQISVRVLPNTDYSKYFIDPHAAEPVGNDLLTWDVVYGEVLRTYALLYPAMNNKIRLDDEAAMMAFARHVIDATQPSRWLSSRYMPPTRDLSASRRQLLQAWCRKVMLPQ
jgi:hypothetical protein